MDTPWPSPLCMITQSSRTFSTSGQLLLLPLKAFAVFLHWVSSSDCHHQRLTIDSLAYMQQVYFLSGQPDRLFSPFKLHHYAFLCLLSMMRVCTRLAKWLIKVTIKTSAFFTSPFPSVSQLQFLLERPLKPVSPEKSINKTHWCVERRVQSGEKKVLAYIQENTVAAIKKEDSHFILWN